MTRHPLIASVLVLALSACDDLLSPAELAQPNAAIARDEAPAPRSPPAPPAGPFSAKPAAGEKTPTSQTTPGPIPPAYRHVWAIDPADCRGDPGLTRIAIAPGAVRFYEGRAVVVKSQVEGDVKLLLDVELVSGGQTSTQRHSLALNDTGSRLIYQRRGESFTYLRCDS